MKTIKFTAVKLIIHILSLICVINISTPKDSFGKQRFAVQIAASKTPVDIQRFSKRHKITDSIVEIKSEDWFRYVVGNFESRRAASGYASKLAIQTGISGVFPREIPESSENSSQVQITEPNTALKVQSILPILTDTVHLELKSAAIKSETDNRASKPVRKPIDKISSKFYRILGIKNVLELKKELIAYGNKHLPVPLGKFYIRVIEKTYAYPAILLFIFLIFIFILNVIFVLLILYFTNQQKNYKDRYIRIFQDMYEDVLRSYLFGEIEWERALVKLKKFKKPLNKRILIAVLFNFQENLSGEMDNRIPQIFVNLGLHNDALKLVKSSLYYNKVKGLRELTNLYHEGALKIVPKYINDNNDLVRAEAQISYIRIHPENPFGFFHKLTTPFTRWTQLSAFSIFRQHQLPVPSFVDFLDSEHPNVRNFCLRMITHFQQLENATEILKLLDSQMEVTRFLCIRAINNLRLFQGKELIKTRYQVETEKNQLEIIKAFRNIGTSEDFDFLENIILSGSVSEKTEVCRSMYYMSNEGQQRLIVLKQNSELKIEQYLAHVIDLRN